MILELILSLAPSLLLGLFIVSLLWPSLPNRRSSLLVRICLSFGIGSGISSLLFFLWLCAFASRGAHFSILVFTEIALLLIACLACVFRVRNTADSTITWPEPPERFNKSYARICAITFWALILCGAASFVLRSMSNPHGDHDAVALWNLRARFFARGTEQWRKAFSDTASIPHPDYPLLLPTTIARSWKYLGQQPVLVPMTVAFLFTFSTVGLTCASLRLLRDREAGYIAGSVLLGVNSFISLGASQYADTVMGFFMLAAIALMAVYNSGAENRNSGLLVLSGACAALCAWVKNEGILFFLLFVAVGLVLSYLRKGLADCRLEAARILIGAIPVLLVVLYFKLRVTSGNYYLTVGGQSANAMRVFLDPGTIHEKLSSFSRYLLISKSMVSQIIHLGGGTIGIVPLLGLYLLASRVKRDDFVIAEHGIVVLTLLLIGYFFVYLTTPLNLEFHLRTSLQRLLIQLWPSFVFLYFLVVSRKFPDLSFNLIREAR